MAPFREEQILIIAPGDVSTLVQYGCGENQGPQQLSLRSGMYFRAFTKTWSYYNHEFVSSLHVDVDTADVARPCGCGEPYEGPVHTDYGDSGTKHIPCLIGSRIHCIDSLFALLLYIYSICKPTLHTPLLLVSSPLWTVAEKEKVTRFCFERLQVPAFAMVSSDIANCIAYSTPRAIVVDVGDYATTVAVVTDLTQDSISVLQTNIGKTSINLSQNRDNQSRSYRTYKIKALELGSATLSSSSTGNVAFTKLCSEHFPALFEEFATLEVNEPIFDADRLLYIVGEISNAICYCMLRSRKLCRSETPIPMIFSGEGALVGDLQQKIYERVTHILESNAPAKSRLNSAGDETNNFKLKENRPERVVLATIPTYLPEWVEKGCGKEFFLGAIIYAKMTFASDTVPKRHITRQDYNEVGPAVASTL